MVSIGKKLSQLRINFAFKLTSCTSRHVLEGSHLTSALPKTSCLFGSKKTPQGAKAHLKSCAHRAALLPGCGHVAPQTPQ